MSAPDWLADSIANSRNLAAGMARATGTDPDREELCVNCDERYCLAPDRAACSHRPICCDCWPNGCPDCEQQVETDLRRREVQTQRILSAVLEVRTSADDLSETDMAFLNWITRKDVKRHTELAIESLRRVLDTLNAQERRRG